ncbi:RICIN domain-containing protein [Pedobacter sp. MC2016-14]|uniref:RICIN domain-containing protein n=1 Tax=Pedobacter sp. MC2016-14 TaxID=2897327 RepID=UPI001E3C27A0|nr:RICIN domain-containing protein [Pedobacter sp. MC2016-14]MCD0488093.1 RICIN domain-containing protein [Pedobacter sp. MC2016-14]
MRRRRFFLNMASLVLVAGLTLTSCKKKATEVEAPQPVPVVETPAVVTTSPLSGETLQTVGNGTFYIVNRKSGMALNVAGASTANGANVIQFGSGGAMNERWTLAAITGGYYSIIGVQSNLSLAVAGASTANEGDINVYTSSTGNEQQWQFTSVGDGYYRITNRNSGKDIEVVGQSLESGISIQQADYQKVESQQWALLPISYSGQLKWTMSSTTGVPAAALTRITNAMNDACARYNAGANWPANTLNVEYNPDVPTADAITSGTIRFGASASYQVVSTAMHEIAHTYGVGLSTGFNSNKFLSEFIGKNAIAKLKSFDGASAVIHIGGSHFWPYGLNYDSEWSETEAFRHVKMIWAMRLDGM